MGAGAWSLYFGVSPVAPEFSDFEAASNPDACVANFPWLDFSFLPVRPSGCITVDARWRTGTRKAKTPYGGTRPAANDSKPTKPGWRWRFWLTTSSTWSGNSMSGERKCCGPLIGLSNDWSKLGPDSLITPQDGTYMSPQLFPRLTFIEQYCFGVLKLSSSEVSGF
jgi:hypothetical protein